MVALNTVVEAPPLCPPVVGLLQAAQIIDHAADDTHWFAGITWAPQPNGATEKVGMCDTSYALSGANSYSTPAVYAPFTIIAHDSCSTWQWELGLYLPRARELLTAKEWFDLEREFESGALISGNSHLASTVNVTYPAGGTISTTPSLSPKDALAALDGAIANAQIGQGMIHAPWYVVAQWVAAKAVTPEEGADIVDSPSEMPVVHPVLFSPNGNIIVAGSGYQGAAPDGSVDAGHDVMWAYATDLITVHREADISVTPEIGNGLGFATDRATNTVNVRVHRAYAVEWSQLLHAAVKVSVPWTAAGVGTTVSVSNFPATQAVSSTTLATAAKQDTQITSLANLDIALSVLRDAIVKTGATSKTLADVVAAIGAATPAGTNVIGHVIVDPATGTPAEQADVTVDGTAGGIQLLPSNVNRKAALIQNVGSANMRVSIGDTPTATHGAQVAPGAIMRVEMPFCPTAAIKAIREGSVSTTAYVLEIT